MSTNAPRKGSDAVYYSGLETPMGQIWLAATDKGLCSVGLGGSEGEYRAALAEMTGAAPQRDDERLAEARRQVDTYLRGESDRFDLPMDLCGGSPFARRVWQAAVEIPYGRTCTYAELAGRLGQPGAARAVGRALGANPAPIVVPCHRVVRSDGTLGGYSGGLPIKERLLALERERACGE